MADKKLVFTLIAKDLASKTFHGVGKAAGGLGKSIASVGMKGLAAGALVAGAGIGLLGEQLIGGIRSAVDYERAANQTIAVIKSTGGAANVTKQHVQDYASSLEALSGVDDDTVIAGENLLLTFTNIRNEAGKGNDVFDQATKASLDLSLALGQDMKSSAIQVGKALNDPIKGVTALQRVGVSFTEQQRDQIKTLVESGKTLEAQKLILGELNKEFGGASKAAGEGFSGALNRTKTALSDAWRSVGQMLLPSLTDLGNWLANTGVPGLQTFLNALMGKSELNEFSGGLKTVNNIGVNLGDAFRTKIVPAVKGLGKGVGWLWEQGKKLWAGLQSGYQVALPFLRDALDRVKDAINNVRTSGVNWMPLLKNLGTALKWVAIIIGAILVASIEGLAVTIQAGAWAFKNVFVPALRFAVDGVLGFLRVIKGFADFMAKLPGPLGAPWRAASRELEWAIEKVEGLKRAIDGVPTHKNVSFTVTVNGKKENVTQYSDGTVSIGGVKARAMGGPITAGEPYWVGENGPELITPGGSGFVTPLSRMRGTGGGGTIVVERLIVQAAMASPEQVGAAVVTGLQSLAARGRPVTLRTLGVVQ